MGVKKVALAIFILVTFSLVFSIIGQAFSEGSSASSQDLEKYSASLVLGEEPTALPSPTPIPTNSAPDPAPTEDASGMYELD
jgi:hypothetical protein